MSINTVKVAIGAAALTLALTPAWAQEPGHQLAGVTPGGGAAMCAQNSEGIARTIDVLNGRIEDARQTNDASKLRAAIADLQIVLAQMKTQLADCIALGKETRTGAMATMPGMDHSKVSTTPGTPMMQPGSPSPAPGAPGTGTAMAGMDHSKMAGMTPSKTTGGASKAPEGDHSKMAGMDHSKMVSAPNSAPAAKSGSSAKAAKPAPMAGMDHSKTAEEKAAAPPADAGAAAAAVPAVVFTVRTDPAPPRNGKNDFEVTLKDPEGKPITDAAVSLTFYMPAMPSMKTDAAPLTSAGDGVYKGSGTIGMTGDWDVTITASRKGQTLATKKMKLTAK